MILLNLTYITYIYRLFELTFCNNPNSDGKIPLFFCQSVILHPYNGLTTFVIALHMLHNICFRPYLRKHKILHTVSLHNQTWPSVVPTEETSSAG